PGWSWLVQALVDGLEVELPGLSVRGAFPARVDLGAVFAHDPHEALEERLASAAPYVPFAALEAHLVDAVDAARVAVEVSVAATAIVATDHRSHRVRRVVAPDLRRVVGEIERRVAQQERAVLDPLERVARARDRIAVGVR